MQKSIVNNRELMIYFDKHDVEILNMVFYIYNARISESTSYTGSYDSFSEFIRIKNEKYICSEHDIWTRDNLPLHIIAPKEELPDNIRLITYIFRIEDQPYMMYLVPEFCNELRKFYPHYIDATQLVDFLNNEISKTPDISCDCSKTYVRNILFRNNIKYLYVKSPTDIYYAKNNYKHKRKYNFYVRIDKPAIEFVKHMIEYYKDSFTKLGNTYYWVRTINGTLTVIRISQKILDIILSGKQV